jgi:hypothetical protein
MKYEIIKTENYLLVVDDSEIKEGDWCLADIPAGDFYGVVKHNEAFAKHYYKKIIAYLPLNNSPILEGVDLLPPLEDKVEKLLNDEINYWYRETGSLTSEKIVRRAFSIGLKAKEKYKYTEEDMIEYSNWLFKWCEYNKYRKLIDGVKPYGIGEFISDKDMFDKFLKEKSLQQPKMPVGFESEDEQTNNKPGCSYATLTMYKTKTTTNPQGLTQWVGRYIY